MRISEKAIRFALEALYSAEVQARESARFYRELSEQSICLDSSIKMTMCAERAEKRQENFGAAYEELLKVLD